jgi:hypothetical protein
MHIETASNNHNICNKETRRDENGIQESTELPLCTSRPKAMTARTILTFDSCGKVTPNSETGAVIMLKNTQHPAQHHEA